MIAMAMSNAGGVWRFGQPGVMEGGRFFLAALVQFARQLRAAKKHVVPLKTFQDEVYTCCGNVFSVGFQFSLVPRPLFQLCIVALACAYLLYSLFHQTLKAWDTVCEMVGDLSETVRSHDDLYTWRQSYHGTATLQ